jgi:hypothetical protein
LKRKELTKKKRQARIRKEKKNIKRKMYLKNNSLS